MTERGILFSAPMVRALLDGSKTQTRRVVKPQPARIGDSTVLDWRGGLFQPERLPTNSNMLNHCPYGQPGDHLWVRETFCLDDNGHEEWPIFRADGVELPTRPATRKPARWTPSIHMPRWASRILLEITSVRVERLQGISEADAIAEGCSGYRPDDDPFRDVEPRDEYRELWGSINGAGSWDANPWVWVVEFKRAQP